MRWVQRNSHWPRSHAGRVAPWNRHRTGVPMRENHVNANVKPGRVGLGNIGALGRHNDPPSARVTSVSPSGGQAATKWGRFRESVKFITMLNVNRMKPAITGGLGGMGDRRSVVMYIFGSLSRKYTLTLSPNLAKSCPQVDCSCPSTRAVEHVGRVITRRRSRKPMRMPGYNPAYYLYGNRDNRIVLPSLSCLR